MTTTTAQIFTIIGVICVPLISLSILVLSLAALNLSLGIRKLYVTLLGYLFDYATKIKRVKEFSIDSDKSSDEHQTTTTNENDKTPLIEKKTEEDPIKISSTTPLLGESKNEINNENESESSHEITTSTTDHEQKISSTSSPSDIQFKLGDIVDYTRQGLEAIVDDDVTKRFTSAEEMAVWNLLTRTQQQHEYFSIRVTLLWFVGFCIRYFILFPFRLFLFIIGITWMLVSAIFLKYFLKRDAKLRYGFYINIVLHRILSRVFSAIITYHNTEYRAKCGSICVANHTSPIDVIILSTDNSFSMIGQKQGGFFGMVQRTLSNTANHIWFERSEAKDRHMVTDKMREHIQNKTNLPILIFPEEAPIYPVAIKYDNRFGDAFWNSSKHGLFQYLILMMTSWAIVVDVYYLPPMTMEENETSVDFARRVKAAIAKQGGFVDLEWDGGLKRSLPKADYKAEEQRKFYEMLKTE
ncbi:unnamed protein product [Rotaria sordida]|uniref:Phospholipid/glycerol acyltransferase domain-containing protein n=1 Tax=Rotaria sordida TaxID=392033 RepID=A0A814FH98_9BILA|nr:unnamed protein product [Rotaria sordida]CAF0985719.1 unnamed protein product [Rotaria sordida]CAF0997299.1 unnamed protein product [Rotaria sordida]